jgi:hypothetical protein
MSLIIDGWAFPDGTGEIEANLFLFARAGEGNNVSRTADQRFENLKRAIDLAFNCEGSIRRVVWNRWTIRILRKLVKNWEKMRFLGLAGCSSSGKSDTVALFGLMLYWARPSETYFIVMSTTKQAARMRIWKSITQFWGQAVDKGCPGKLIDSDGYIKGVDQNGKLWRNSGVVLMAAGNSDAEQACKDLLGIKNPVVMVAADEFNELGEGILKTAFENMTSNDRMVFCGMANPDKLTDPFADLCEPLDGWKSVTEEDEEWPTKYGECIRLDAEKSPRIMDEGGDKFFWQPDMAYCDRIAEARGGRKSRGYYRFVKAFWCPDGAANSIYSEVEFMNGSALDQNEPDWDSPPIVLTGLDASFSRNGDRSSSAYAKLGKVNGTDHLHFCHYQTFSEDINDKDTSHSHQIARQWRDLSMDFGVKAFHATLDNTGAGTPFGHIVDMEWSPAVSKINFQAKSSERTVVFRNEDCTFYNKNSELWIQPKEYFRCNQISGISKEVMAELVEREYHPKEGRTLRVESKEEAKKRLKRSPDLADAVLLVIDKAISLGRLQSVEVKSVAKLVDHGWRKAQMKKSISTGCGRRLRH